MWILCRNLQHNTNGFFHLKIIDAWRNSSWPLKGLIQLFTQLSLCINVFFLTMIVLFLLFVDPSQHKIGLDWDPTLGHAALGHVRGSALKIQNSGIDIFLFRLPLNHPLIPTMNLSLQVRRQSTASSPAMWDSLRRAASDRDTCHCVPISGWPPLCPTLYCRPASTPRPIGRCRWGPPGPGAGGTRPTRIGSRRGWRGSDGKKRTFNFSWVIWTFATRLIIQ